MGKSSRTRVRTQAGVQVWRSTRLKLFVRDSEQTFQTFHDLFLAMASNLLV